MPAAAGSVRRVLTTHVGSLPRPARVAELLLARELDQPFDSGELDDELAAAVAAAVARQVATGIDVVSDGEMSKISYATYVKDRLTGFGGNSPRKPALDLAPHGEFAKRMATFAGEQRFKRMSCIGPVEYVGHADLAADLTRLRAAADSAGAFRCFMNAASPGLVSAFQPNEHYPDHAAYVEAVGAAMRVEYAAIIDAGFDLQLDCPDLAMARHTGFQALSDDEFVARAAHAVEVLNEATADLPAERMRMHVCWGNYEGPHDHDIALDAVLPVVLSARPATILFEAANPRHEHEWTVWAAADVAADKVLAPGVIASTSNYVEHPELVAQRIDRYVAIVGAERVIASTDCGFGTFAGIGRVDPEIAYKKLASLVEGARVASERVGAAA
jgi:5-methyltetrahydropteroyltriglutamate--homocysteine methyltransferase